MANRPDDDIYERIKREIGYLKVFDFLGLDMKPASSPTAGSQYRGPDPVCGRGGNRALVYTIAKASWCCHSSVCSPKTADGKSLKTKGGDIIGLVAHVKGIKQGAAAKLLADTFLREPEKPKKRTRRKPTPSVHNPKPVVGGTGTIVDIMNL